MSTQRLILRTATCLLGLALVNAEGQGPQAKSVPGEPMVYKTVEGRGLKLYVVKPKDWRADDRRPAVVFFHGGGFVGGGPSAFATQAEYLAARGLVGALVEYRLVERGRGEPPTNACKDAKSAMRWVRGHAKDLGVDPDRIAAAGGSAGGYLTGFVAMIDGQDDPQDDLKISPKPQAMGLFNAVLDVRGGKWAERLGDRARDFSPVEHVTAKTPPAVMFLGEADQLIPVQSAKDFQSAMAKQKVRCDLFTYPEQPHAFFNREPYTTLTLIEMDKFLASLGWLKGPPTLSPPPRAAGTSRR